MDFEILLVYDLIFSACMPSFVMWVATDTTWRTLYIPLLRILITETGDFNVLFRNLIKS